MNWRKIAANRLREIRVLKRVAANRAQEIEGIVRRELAAQIHARCLGSLSDERWQQTINEVAAAVAERSV